MSTPNEPAPEAPGLRVEVLAQFEVPELAPEVRQRLEAGHEKVVFEAPLGENRLLRVIGHLNNAHGSAS